MSINKMVTIKYWALFFTIFLIVIISSCKKMVDIDPPYTKITSDNVFKLDNTAIQTLNGIYMVLSGEGQISGGKGFSFLCGLSADEFLYYGSNTQDVIYYQNALISDPTPVNSIMARQWGVLYGYIYNINIAIEGLNESKTLSPAVKQQLSGETKFLRAFYYYYLVNLFGDVPLALTTDWKVNSLLPRTAVDIVYDQIVSDLKEAQNLLSDQYLDGNLGVYSNNTERSRPTKMAASALLARVYLSKQDFVNAEIQASSVISNPSFSLVSLNSVFLKNNLESIWQLQPVVTGHNTEDAWMFVLTSSGPGSQKPVSLSNFLLNSFEPNDQRRKSWVDSVTVSGVKYYYPAKYRSATLNAPLTEYQVVLRLGEQYLIRAEARAQQNKLQLAIDDVNYVRLIHGGLTTPLVTPPTVEAAMSEVLHERQVELFTELGHRWIDLKRFQKIDSVMNIVTPIKANGKAWQSYQQLYPIPFNDIEKNPNLKQNAGY